MARLRFNNSIGSLGASLTSSGTTVTFAAAPTWPTISGGDYLPLILDPPNGSQANSSFEIVYVTAYTAGATTATVQRGMEGTTQVAHSAGAVWTVAPTALDVTSLSTPVAARAYRNAALTISASAYTKVPVDTLSYDSGSNMDVATNHRFNCPVAGYYQVSAAVWTGQATYAAIYKNGVDVAESGYNTTTNQGEASVSDILKCNAGDYIELYVFSTTTALLGPGGSTASLQNYLSVALLAPVQVSGVVNVARAYRNAAFSFSSATWTKVPLDAKSFDPQGSMDTVTNGRYNVPVGGFYQVEGNIDIGAGKEAYVAVRKNGTEIADGYVNAGASSGVAVASDILQCVAGDYLELYVYSPTGTALTGVGTGSVNYLSVAQVVAPVSSASAQALPYGASYQNGVINSGDLAISAISINGSTGALTFTLAAANPVIVKDASGLLVPVQFSAGTFTYTPGTLPTASNSRVVGVELDPNGLISLVVGSSVSGTQTTASTLETNTPAVTSGRLRVADIGVYNAAGTYKASDNTTTWAQGTNYVDRRPWARGAHIVLTKAANTSGAVNNTWTAWDTTNLQARLELTGAPVVVEVVTSQSNSSGSASGFTGYMYDGGNPPHASAANVGTATQPFPFVDEFIPSAGSHLFALAYYITAGTLTLNGTTAGYSLAFSIREVLQANSNNGTA